MDGVHLPHSKNITYVTNLIDGLSQNIYVCSNNNKICYCYFMIYKGIVECVDSISGNHSLEIGTNIIRFRST